MGVDPAAFPDLTGGPGARSMTHPTDPPPSTPWVTRVPSASGAPAAAGPLAGTVLAVKDLIAVAGVPLRAGSRTRSHAPPEPHDAPIVAQLRAAGAVVTGTVALHELAFGVTGINDELGFPPHPLDPTRIPGGSSSGSAVAVALRQADLAIGTDTGGSVRIPAALCGIVGFKPSRDRYPLDRVLPLSPTLDHIGLLARHLTGIVAAHTTLTGDTIPTLTPHLRLGIDRAGLADADHTIATAIEATLRRLADAGAELIDIDWPDRTETLDVTTTIMFSEAATTHHTLLTSPRAHLLSTPVRERLETGATITPAAYNNARAAGERIEAHVRKTLTTLDAVLGPTVPITAPTITAARTDPTLARRLVADTRLANLTGTPAITLPLHHQPLPAGLQITGLTDTHTLAVAALVQ
jgi:Asp-tRNA(Asn)/Glu-tRNA(Gln) amidotransferase A subunit family amidase